MHNKKGSQIDIAVSDFSKVFDTVPHDDLLSNIQALQHRWYNLIQ